MVTPMRETTLVLGGARSGKSRHAEMLARASCGPHHYIATAEIRDDAEMAARIARHRAERGGGWTTHETPFALVERLEALVAAPSPVVVLDCLTLWLTNLILDDRDIAAESRRLAGFVARCPYRLIMVSNEVGLSIVPDNALARRFRDEAGILNQTIAAASSEVIFMAAGLPLHLKNGSQATDT